MKKSIIFIYLALTALIFSCTKDKIIPKDTMSEIYYDIYMTDRLIQSNPPLRKVVDTSKVYEPIFNKYGYTTDEYTQSVNYYLEHPDRYVKIFKKTQKMFQDRKMILENAIETERLKGRKWPLIDSLEILCADSLTVNPYYRVLRMMFFEPDTTIADSPLTDSTRYDIPVSGFMLFSENPYRTDTIRINSPRLADFYFANDTTAASDTLSAEEITALKKKEGQQKKKEAAAQKKESDKKRKEAIKKKRPPVIRPAAPDKVKSKEINPAKSFSDTSKSNEKNRR